mmetsp:Transcript_17207/g.24223  ORF Transcript_17207/g.24223 Transcript_17207/m.24223 type:complete len:226 (+) Transcript_17207:141-818(+)
MSSFQEKAAAVAQKLAAASLTPQEATAKSLAQDRPTIDSAIKSYMSLISARSITQNTPADTCVLSSQDALTCCRVLSKSINAYTFAVGPDEEEASVEQSVTAQLWNGLVASNQKPSRYLGRKALLHAFDDLLLEFPKTISQEETTKFINEFGTLLKYTKTETDEDSDGALLWDEDGGKAELERRRKRRTERAVQQKEKEKEEDSSLPLIEELPDEDAKEVQNETK